MMYEFFNVLLNSFAKILLRTFAYMLISDIVLWFSFFVLSLPGFGVRITFPHIVSLKVFLPVKIFERVLEE